MVEPLTAAVVLAPALKHSLDRLARSFTLGAEKMAKSLVDQAVVELRIGFSNYFTTSFNKCRCFKSLLNANQPLDLVENYIHVTLSLGQKRLTDDELIFKIPELKSIVIMGLAGSGKSMFMKYLTMRYFAGLNDIAPLFVELRHVNSLTNPDLLSYIRSSATGKTSGITQEKFEIALRAGGLLLVLDGFDEINHAHRDNIQAQILNIQKDFPSTPIVLSSRPDDRFGSWQTFYGYKVDKLTEEQCITLIRGLEYDDGVKKRFEKEVSHRLYSSHKSFLSSPLLTTIMLLTFEDFAEVPDKMHLFYSQAFDTLFQKHDAHKEQFQRKTHTTLVRDDFKATFAAFSAFSYVEQLFSFDDDQLMRTAKQALTYMKQTNESFKSSVTEKQFIDDLLESVCMLQRDGLDTNYVHRSFQEYFAALFVTSIHGEMVGNFLNYYACRWNDSVIVMARDMARQTVEQEWVIPAITKLQAELALGEGKSCVSIFSKMFPSLTVRKLGEELKFNNGAMNLEIVGLIESLARLYPEYISPQSLFKPLDGLDVKTAKKLWCSKIVSQKPRSEEFSNFFKRKVSEFSEYPELEITLNEDDNWWLEAVGYNKYLENLIIGLQKVHQDVSKRAKKHTSILETLLPKSKPTIVQRKRAKNTRAVKAKA